MNAPVFRRNSDNMFVRRTGSVFKSIYASSVVEGRRISVWAKKAPFISANYHVRVDARGIMAAMGPAVAPPKSNATTFPEGLYWTEGKLSEVLDALAKNKSVDVKGNQLNEHSAKAVAVVKEVAKMIRDRVKGQ